MSYLLAPWVVELAHFGEQQTVGSIVLCRVAIYVAFRRKCDGATEGDRGLAEPTKGSLLA
jgi:hypothetical protein